jgi:hypothetical protein
LPWLCGYRLLTGSDMSHWCSHLQTTVAVYSCIGFAGGLTREPPVPRSIASIQISVPSRLEFGAHLAQTAHSFRDGDRVLLVLPHQHGCAVACLPYTSELDDVIADFADGAPTLCEMEIVGNA